MAITKASVVRGLGNRRQEIASVVLGLLAGCLLGFFFMTVVEMVIRAGSAGDNDRGADSPPFTELTSRSSGRSKAGSKASMAVQTAGDTIHTLCTSNGSPYLNIQTRIMYGTYQLVQEMPGGDKLVGFTRILHRTQPDVLMKLNEVPTFRADPLTPQCDNWCEFPVSDRPNAVAQFFKAVSRDPGMIKAPWLLMLEGDYVWMKPLQAPRAETATSSWAYPYSYIAPEAKNLEPFVRLMYPEERGPTSGIPKTGPAPVLMQLHEWIKVMPDWERLTAHIESHADTKEALGWVREMYAFSIAAALQDIKLELKPPVESPLMVQPPADDQLRDAALCHYTWETLVEENGEEIWIFDKRKYTAAEMELKVPLIPLPPPFRPGLKLHDGSPYTPKLHNMTVAMLTQMNRAIAQMDVLSKTS